MNVYMYQAALFCENCGESIRLALINQRKAPADVRDENSYDSDEFPKGPYPDGGGESDSPQHCDHCGLFLENPLTDNGRTSIQYAINQYLNLGHGAEPVIKEWSEFYDLPLEVTEGI